MEIVSVEKVWHCIPIKNGINFSKISHLSYEITADGIHCRQIFEMQLQLFADSYCSFYLGIFFFVIFKLLECGTLYVGWAEFVVPLNPFHN